MRRKEGGQRLAWKGFYYIRLPHTLGPQYGVDMATARITVTLPVDHVKKVQSLVAAGAAPNVSAFIQRAVDAALLDAACWRATLDEAMQQTGGPLTDKERAWVDSLLLPLLPRRPKKADATPKASRAISPSTPAR